MFHQITKKIIALVTTVCLLVGVMVVPSAAADDTQMYFYNGVELPALSMLETYPYVFIEDEGDGKYTAYCSASPLYLKLNSNGDEYVLFKEIPCAYYNYDVSISPVWREVTVNDTWGGTYIKYIAPLWSNHDIVNSVDGTVYIKGTHAVPVDSVSDIPDGESILDVLNSIFDYDVATWNLLAFGINRIRFIERDVADIREALLKLIPSEQEIALKESTKETTQAVNDSLFADDAPTKVTVDDVTDVAQVGSAAAQMFNPGVGVSAFFDAFNNINLVSLFTQASIDDMYAVDEATTFSLGKDDGVVDYYTENFNKIKEFVGSGD